MLRGVLNRVVILKISLENYLAGGLAAGTLDVGAAALIGRVDPRVILRFIAGGVQGATALQGGAASAWLGLFLQWGMSLVIATVFVLAALRLR